MQRAATSPQTPTTSPSGPPSKRVRLSNGTASPVTPSSTLQDALDAEEAQRLRALERHAEAVGETRWVLSVQEKPKPANGTLNVVTASFGDIDALSDDEHQLQKKASPKAMWTRNSEEAPMEGRRIFGKMKKRHFTSAAQDEPESSTSSSESGEVDDDDPAAQLIREERKEAATLAREKLRAKRKNDQEELSRLAVDRRKKEVNLNQLTSISGGGHIGSGSSTPSKDITCYGCGMQGHTKRQCPNRLKQP